MNTKPWSKFASDIKGRLFQSLDAKSNHFFPVLQLRDAQHQLQDRHFIHIYWKAWFMCVVYSQVSALEVSIFQTQTKSSISLQNKSLKTRINKKLLRQIIKEHSLPTRSNFLWARTSQFPTFTSWLGSLGMLNCPSSHQEASIQAGKVTHLSEGTRTNYWHPGAI